MCLLFESTQVHVLEPSAQDAVCATQLPPAATSAAQGLLVPPSLAAPPPVPEPPEPAFASVAPPSLARAP